MKKILNTILILILATAQAFSQNVPSQPLQPSPSDLVFVIDNFSQGLEGHVSPYSMSMGMSTDVYNARFNDEYGAISKRPALSTYSNCNHSAAVTGLYRFYQSSGNKYTVTSASTAGTDYLDYAPDGGGSCINLFSSGNSVGARWNFATYKDMLVATNGTDYPQKWDGIYQTTADTTGSRSAGYLTAQLGAPFTQMSTGSGLTSSDWYQYVIAYWDGTNYWYSTARSNPLQMGAATNDQVSLTGIPLGPATTLARYLFRTKGQSSAANVIADTSFFFVTALNDDVTQTYTDSISDSSITTAAGAIQSISINNAGTSYTKGDVLTVVETGGSSGTATVSSIYSTGSGATITITTGSGIITGKSVVAAGTGYAVGDVLTVLGGNNDARLTVASLSGTGVASVNITVGGTGYVNTTGAPTSDSGTITTISLTTGGTGYISANGLAVTGGSGSGATVNITTTPSWAIAMSNNNSVFGGLNVTPPHGVFPLIAGGGSASSYLWLSNDPSGVQYGQSTAYFSSPGDIDYFLSTNYFLVRPDDGDPITFTSTYLGTFTVGKTNSISKIYTAAASSSSWSVSPPFSYIGCIAPYSAVSTPGGIVYLGRYGIYEFNGQNSELISDVINNDVLDINQANLGNVSAIMWKNEYRIAYPSSQAGATSNNRVMVYDMIRNDFVKDTENINVWATFGSNGDFGGLYSGSSGTDGAILSHSQQPTELIVKYLSDFNAGTFSNTAAFGTQTQPVVSLSLPTWANWNVEWKNMGSATWQASAQPGTWISSIYNVNASALSTVQWNTSMPAGTSTTMAIRTASSSSGIASATWSSEFTNPSGSNISAVSANNYLQMRITFNTASLTMTPSVYVQNNYAIQLIYSPAASVAETSIPTSWTSGWMDLVTSPYMFYMSNFPKSIKEIDVYYEGTAGLLNISMQNLKGDSKGSFSVDMSQPVNQVTYFGPGTSEPVGSPGNYMVYVYKVPLNGPGGLSGLYGDKWMLNIQENGTTAWRVERIAIRYDLEPYASYH